MDETMPVSGEQPTLDPNELVELVNVPEDYTGMFRGARAYRDEQTKKFLEDWETFAPDLFKQSQVEINPINDKTPEDQSGDRTEHGARVRAYTDLTRAESFLRAQIENGQQLSQKDAMMLRWLNGQKARLAFIHGAESMAERLADKQFLSHTELSDFMQLWAHEVWGKTNHDEALKIAGSVLPPEGHSPNLSNPRYQVLIDGYLEALKNKGIEKPTEVESLSPEALDYYHEMLIKKFQPMFNHMFEGIEGEEFSEADAQPIFQRALDYLGLSKQGWKCVVDLDRARMSVEVKDKTVYIGRRDEPYTREMIMRLVLHEVVVHAGRGHNGMHVLGDPLLGKGLPGYLDFEEGLANSLEFALVKEVKNSLHKRRYLAVAYAQGAIDGRIHNFPETTQFLAGYDILEKIKAGQTVDSIDGQKTMAEAKEVVNRLFRGLESGLKGVNDLSAASYHNGALKAIKVLEPAPGQFLSEAEFDRLLVGKYDPTDDQHLAYVDEALKGLDEKSPASLR